MTTPARLISAWRPQSISTLVQALRESGFSVGASEASDATRLLIQLAEREPGLDHPARLRTKMRPVFCKTREEQERFDAIFEQWAERVVLTWKTPDNEAKSDSPVAEPEHPMRRGRQLPVAAVLVIVAGLAVMLWRYAYVISPGALPDQLNQAGGGAVPPSPLPATAGVTGSTAAIDRYVPAVRYNRELRTVWVWLLLALPMLPILGVSLPAMVLSRTRLRRNPDPMVLDPRPLEVEARRLVPSVPQDVSDRLARHVRSAGLDLERLARRPVLDVRGTIEATIRNHGVPTLKFSHSRIHPSYLLLVDVANERDARGRLYFQWAERLQRESLDVEILLIRTVDEQGSKALAFCPPGPSGRDRTNWKPLARLRAPAFGERLIVISDGDPLVDRHGDWRPAATKARLYRWRDRVVFTPVEPRDWGRREEAIERRERAADPGFIVLPLEESALAAWTDLVLTGQLSTVELSDPQRFPALLRRGYFDEYLKEEPPATDEVETLIAQLRIYLGNWGFQWLAACAVPPIVRWELALLLGRDVLKDLPAPLKEQDINEALASNYRRLVRLPWMQQEAIPQWLRLRLLGELPSGRHGELQRLVRNCLGALSPRSVADGIELNFERPPGEHAALAREPDGGRERNRTDRRSVGDPLYLGYLRGLTPEQLVLRAPREWAGWARKIRMRRPSGVRGWMARLSDRSASWWARMAWRDGLPHLGMNRRTRLLSLLFAAPIVILLLASSRWSIDDEARFAASWLLVEKPRAIAWSSGDRETFSVAFSPDGTRIVSGGAGGALRLSNAQNGAPIGAPMRGHTNRVRCLAFSSDGTRIVSGSYDGTLRLWDGRTAVPIGEPMHHMGGAIWSVAFSPDGARLLSAGQNATLRIWDARTLAPMAAYTLNERELPWSSAISPDATQVLSGSGDGRLQLWDARSGVPLSEPVLGHADGVMSVIFSPDGTRAVSVSVDRTVQLWDVRTLTPGEPLSGRPGSLWGVAFSPDGTRLVFAGEDGTMRLWDARTGALVGEALQGYTDRVLSVAFSPDGARLVSANASGTLRLWNARAAAPIGEPMRGPADFVNSLAYSPDGARLVSGGNDGALRFWDARTQAQIGEALQGHTGTVWDVATSPDGTRVVSGGGDGTLRVWDARTGASIGEPLRGHQGWVLSVVFTPDGTRLVSSGADASVRLWDARTGAPIAAPLRGHTGSVPAVAVSSDGTWLVSAGNDGTLRRWDARTGAPIGEPLTGHTDSLRTVAISPDGMRLSSGSVDRTVRLWDARTGALIGTPLEGHAGAVESVAFSPDGLRLVSSGFEGTLRLWDARTGRPIGSPVTATGGSFLTAVFSPDGRNVAAAVSRSPISQPTDQQRPKAPAGQQPSPGRENSALEAVVDENPIRLWRLDPWPPPDPERTGNQLRASLASWLIQPDGRRLVVGAPLIAAMLFLATTRWRRRRATGREIAAGASA